MPAPHSQHIRPRWRNLVSRSRPRRRNVTDTQTRITQSFTAGQCHTRSIIAACSHRL